MNSAPFRPLRWLAAFVFTSALTSAASDARSTIISFSTLTNVPGVAPNSNGEVNGTEWVASGLLLQANTLALNVGCQNQVDACLGADDTSISDFNGMLTGRWVVPGTTTQSSVYSMGITFCCEDFDRPVDPDPITEVQIFGSNGSLLATILDQDFYFFGSTPIAYFTVRFGTDGMTSIAFNEAPTPPSLALALLGLIVAGKSTRARLK